MKLASLYALLSLVATAVNIGSQDLLLRLYHGPSKVVLSIAVGAGIGLVVKYVLDKRYLGGAIGLGIGYVTKYYLDKRYVFRTAYAAAHLQA